MTNSALLPYQDLKDAFKDGGGIVIDTYPSELWHALDHTGCTRYRNFLMHDWLPHLKHTTQKLAQGGSMADLRCGPGRGTIKLANPIRWQGFTVLTRIIKMFPPHKKMPEKQVWRAIQTSNCGKLQTVVQELLTWLPPLI